MTSGFCIFVDTVFQGPVPTVSDGDGHFVVFASAEAAQREIAEYTIARVQQFLGGERDFADATTVEEYVMPVRLERDGRLTDAEGRILGAGVAD